MPAKAGHNFGRPRHYGAGVFAQVTNQKVTNQDLSRTKIAIMIRNPVHAAAFALTVLAAGIPGTAFAQMDPSDLVVRLDQLQNQVRQLTGTVEQLQFRNQQLEQQMKRMQEDTEFRLQELSRGGARPQQQPQRTTTPAPPPANSPGPLPPPQQGRGDAFDPAANPAAPGVPRQLGAPGRRSDAAPQGGMGPGPTASARSNDPINTVIMNEEPQEGGSVGVPGGREPGAPLDLSNTSRSASAGDAAPPSGNIQRQTLQGGAPPPAAPPAGATAALSPAQQIREEYDLAYSNMLRKDYAAAEEGLRGFITKHPRDKLAGDAQFWIGESQFQRQSWRAAADSFVVMSKKYANHAKAPDALLRLGQSLASLNEKELACATFGEVGNRYPRASQSVKQTIEREQKRVRC
jgi:tol-pal system protein YbgF